MRTRRIAVVGLNDDAAHAFQSMLKIVDGRSRAAWSVSTPDDADVLMAGIDAKEAVVERWARTEKPLIAVHEGMEGRPMTPFTLCHPFRVMQLLGVLDEVERSLESLPPVQGVPPLQAKTATSPWAFAESLRWLSRRSAGGHRYAAASIDGTVFVQDDLSAYHIDPDSLDRLRHGKLRLPPLQMDSSAVPVGFLRRPVFELAWFVGMHESASLAPWLDANAAYRLRRWPDFGMVRGTREHLALAALLAREAQQREHLANVTNQPLAGVDRFLNACSIAGLLNSSVGNTATKSAGGAATMAPTRFGGLISSLRRRLGLTE
jgi:hypothetical protein